MRYHDFELRVAQEKINGYSVYATSRLAGEARGVFTFDPDAGDVRAALQKLEAADTGLSLLQDLGNLLFRALFQGDVRDLFHRSLGMVERQEEGLRLRLNLEPLELSSLPWEYMYDEARDYFLSSSPSLTLSRYIPVAQPIKNLFVSPPLKLLVAISAPRDLRPVDIDAEKRAVQLAVEELTQKGQIELQFLPHAKLVDLQRRLREGFHFVHFIGHGGFDEKQGGVLAFEDEDGYCQNVRETEFQTLFLGDFTTKLVLLSACEGATSSSTRQFVGIAQNLVRRGLPAVIAMQYPVPVGADRIFFTELYTTLADGWPVDACVAEGRKAVFVQASHEMDWGIPVLFMRAADGRILDSLARKQERAAEEAQRAILQMGTLLEKHEIEKARLTIEALVGSLEEFAELHGYLRELSEWKRLLGDLEQSFSPAYEEIRRLQREGLTAVNLNRDQVVDTWGRCKTGTLNQLLVFAQNTNFIEEANEQAERLAQVQGQIDRALEKDEYGRLVQFIRKFYELLAQYRAQEERQLDTVINDLCDLSNRLIGRHGIV